MAHAVKVQIENLESLKGQIEYTKNALKSDLEEWERKEYSVLLSDLKNESQRIKSVLDRVLQ